MKSLMMALILTIHDRDNSKSWSAQDARYRVKARLTISIYSPSLKMTPIAKVSIRWERWEVAQRRVPDNKKLRVWKIWIRRKSQSRNQLLKRATLTDHHREHKEAEKWADQTSDWNQCLTEKRIKTIILIVSTAIETSVYQTHPKRPFSTLRCTATT